MTGTPAAMVRPARRGTAAGSVAGSAAVAVVSVVFVAAAVSPEATRIVETVGSASVSVVALSVETVGSASVSVVALSVETVGSARVLVALSVVRASIGLGSGVPIACCGCVAVHCAMTFAAGFGVQSVWNTPRVS